MSAPTDSAGPSVSDVLEALRSENTRLRAVLETIAARPTKEGGCYYNNRFSVFEARAALRSAAEAACGDPA